MARIEITGSVLKPDGNGVAGGTIVIRPSAPGTWNDGVDEQVVAGQINVTISATGVVTAFDIVPNDQITPAGTTYFAQYLPDAASSVPPWVEAWSVTGVVDLTIGQITRV